MRELERDPRNLSAAQAAIPVLAVVGAGRVGSSLVAAARGAGIEATAAGREDALERCREAEVALLCVPDAAIEEAAESIASAVPPLAFVGHTSGASGLEPLASPAAAGAAAFSLHPLQTVPDHSTDFTGCPCAISASTPAALALAGSLAERLGMRPFEIAERDRAAYHAAASMASNFLVALEQSAAELLAGVRGEGEDAARELLAPLVLRTAANWSERGSEALTGPIARGDEATVARHLEALRERAPELIPLYRALADRARSIAEGRP
jgi:predicted short-subunit dehydrogenase-like oxidoreductase (DUF2520 family)